MIAATSFCQTSTESHETLPGPAMVRGLSGVFVKCVIRVVGGGGWRLMAICAWDLRGVGWSEIAMRELYDGHEEG